MRKSREGLSYWSAWLEKNTCGPHSYWDGDNRPNPDHQYQQTVLENSTENSNLPSIWISTTRNTITINNNSNNNLLLNIQTNLTIITIIIIIIVLVVFIIILSFHIQYNRIISNWILTKQIKPLIKATWNFQYSNKCLRKRYNIIIIISWLIFIYFHTYTQN